MNQQVAIKAFTTLVQHKMNPELDAYQMLDIYRKIGLKDAANYLHSLI